MTVYCSPSCGAPRPEEMAPRPSGESLTAPSLFPVSWMKRRSEPTSLASIGRWRCSPGSSAPAIGMAVDKILQFTHLPFGSTKEHVSEPASTGQAEDQPSWAEIVRHAEHGESVSVIAPSGDLDRLRETIEVLPDSELVRDLREGLADARDGRVFSGNPHRLGQTAGSTLWRCLDNPARRLPRPVLHR